MATKTKTFDVTTDGSFVIKLTDKETGCTMSIYVDIEGKDPIGTIIRESYFFKKIKEYSYDKATSILTAVYV